MKAQLPVNEEQRLVSLGAYKVLDTAQELGFDDLTLLASQICQSPVALVSLIDEHRQWFKSKIGISISETSRSVAFCAHAILNPAEILEVNDAIQDSRFSDNPLVTEDPHIRFYAGAPIVTPEGYALGTLCVIDYVPRKLNESQKYALQALSRHVMTLLELRLKIIENKKIEVALRESEVRFRDLVENAHDLIQIIGLDGSVLYVNRAWQETMGYNEADTKKLKFQDIIHPDALSQYMAKHQMVLKENKIQQVNSIFITKDGREVLVEGNSTCRISEGKSYSVRSIFRDITERKQAEEKILTLVESSPFGIVMINDAGVIVLVSKMTEQLFGYARAELIGQPIELLIPERFHAIHTDHRGKFFAEPSVRAMGKGRDLFGLKRDGSEFPLEIGLSPFNTSAGMFVMASIVDITERKKLQLALEQFKYTLDQTIDCVFISNADDFRFEYVNKGAMQQIGYSEAELLQMIVPDIKPDYSPDQYRVLVQPLLDGIQYSLTIETKHQHKDGHVIPVEVNLQAVRFENLPPRLIVIVRDITERKRAEKLLRDKNLELKGFAYTVSHDLKAPLRGIAGYAQELERRHKEGLSERAQFCITQVITASHNLDRLIEDLLAYSRLDAETPTHTTVNLAGLVKSILNDRSHTLAEQHVEVNVSVPEMTLLSWERGLHQVLTNLIDNAIKYSRNSKPPQLNINAETTTNGILIKITDNGIGFDMKYHDRIFGLFNRLVRVDEFSGTGAGLSIVKKLAEKLGGTIRAESEPGKGATFIFELPQVITTKAAI